MEGQLDPMHAMVTLKPKVEGIMAKMLMGAPLVLDSARCCRQVVNAS